MKEPLIPAWLEEALRLEYLVMTGEATRLKPSEWPHLLMRKGEGVYNARTGEHIYCIGEFNGPIVKKEIREASASRWEADFFDSLFPCPAVVAPDAPAPAHVRARARWS